MFFVITFPKLSDHPFLTLAFFRGGGVKKLPNLTTDSSKKMPTERGRGQNRKNLPTSLMDGPYIYFLDGGLGERISTNHHSVVKKNSITN